MKKKINSIQEILKHQKVGARTKCSSTNKNLSRKTLIEMAQTIRDIDQMKKDKFESGKITDVIPDFRSVLTSIDEKPTKKTAEHNGR